MAITINPNVARDPQNVAEILAIIDESTLPELIGTEQQVAWASEIRSELLQTAAKEVMVSRREALRYPTDEQAQKFAARMNTAFAEIRSQTTARWYINRKEVMGNQLLNQTVRDQKSRDANA